MSKAIFLDRDGTLNKLIKRPDGRITGPWTISEFKAFPFARKTITLANHLGYKSFVLSEQSSVKGGEVDFNELEKMNKKLYTFGVDGVYNSPIKDHISDIIRTYKIDRKGSYMITSSRKFILDGYHNDLICLWVGSKVAPFDDYNLCFASALDAVKFIQKKDKKNA